MEKLADRLSWERGANGILVVIPARRDWTVLFFAAWLVGWTIGGKAAFHETFAANGQIQLFMLAWLVGWVFGECFATAAVLWALGGRTILRLDPTRLEIERNLFGVRLSSRSAATGEIRNLRFSPRIARGRWSKASEIRFESADKTLGFGSGISDAEAFALIDKMLEVYPFPKERAAEYLDLSR
jgi:hypothetical protein